MTRSRLLVVLALTAVGCVRWGRTDSERDDAEASSGDDGWDEAAAGDLAEPDPPPPRRTGGAGTGWPDPWPVDPDARIAVWGRTGIPTRNLRLWSNLLQALGAADASEGTATGTEDGGGTGGGSTGEGGEDGGQPADAIDILWISDCDPRTDAVGCLAGNVQPFFDTVQPFGTIAFEPLSAVDPLAYDVVVADFCGPVVPEQIGELLGDGGHVLVLGDQWCITPDGSSAERANVVLERVGARFNGEELYDHDFAIADASGLLEGVEVVDAWGLALIEVSPRFGSVFGTLVGSALAVRR